MILLFHNLESSLELSSSSSEEQVPLANFVKRARVSTSPSRVCARDCRGGRIGHVRGIQNRVAQCGGVRVRGGSLGSSRCNMLNAIPMHLNVVN